MRLTVEQKKRLSVCLRQLGGIVGIGLCYAVFVHVTGLYLPCPFRLATGFLCPGCGISHLCMALLRLDIRSAFDANAAVLCLSPGLLLVFGCREWGYIKTGRRELSGWQRGFVWAAIVLLLIFGVLRNVRGGLL